MKKFKEGRNYIFEFGDYSISRIKLTPKQYRELLISMFKMVKGITIPDTDEEIAMFVDKYSN